MRSAPIAVQGSENAVQYLGDEKRQKLINHLDERRSRRDGDGWEVFKYPYEPGYWSRPANIEAILRVAESMPNALPDEDDPYGSHFRSVLEEVKRLHGNCHSEVNWSGDGI
jgi:hypothetical protein